nr:MAG TPA: hypothetical protein [Caudoviricetes sp.]
MSISALTPRAHPLARIPTSVPFTYRDGVTTLQLIECIRCNLDGLQSDFNTLVEQVNQSITDNNAAVQQIADNLVKQMALLRDELIRLIEQSQSTGVAWSPAYGKQDALQTVLDGMYDNTRNHALFWRDYDNMGLQAVLYDDLGLTARDYDLRATSVDNCVPGDFPGRSQFPYGKSIPEGKPVDVCLTTDSASDKIIVKEVS